MAKTRIGQFLRPRPPYGITASVNVVATTPDVALAPIDVSVASGGSAGKGKVTRIGRMLRPRQRYTNFQKSGNVNIAIQNTPNISVTAIGTAVTEGSGQTNIQVGLLTPDPGFDTGTGWTDIPTQGSMSFGGGALIFGGAGGFIGTATHDTDISPAIGDYLSATIDVSSMVTTGTTFIIYFGGEVIYNGTQGIGVFTTLFHASTTDDLLVVSTGAVNGNGATIESLSVHHVPQVSLSPIDVSVLLSPPQDVTATTPNITVAAVQPSVSYITTKTNTRIGRLLRPRPAYIFPFFKNGVFVNVINTPNVVVSPIDTSVVVTQTYSITATTGAITVAAIQPTVRHSEVANTWFNGHWWPVGFWGANWWKSLGAVFATTPNITITAYDVSVGSAADIRPNTPNVQLAAIDVSLNNETSVTATTPDVAVASVDAIISTVPYFIYPTTPNITVAGVDTTVLADIDAFPGTPNVAVAGITTTITATYLNIIATTPNITLTSYTTSVNGSTSVDATTPDITVAAVDTSVNNETSTTATTPGITVVAYDTTVNAEINIVVQNVANISVVAIDTAITGETLFLINATTPNVSVVGFDVDISYLESYGVIVKEEPTPTGSIIADE